MIAFASFVRLAFRQRALHFSGNGRYVLLDFFFLEGGVKGSKDFVCATIKLS